MKKMSFIGKIEDNRVLYSDGDHLARKKDFYQKNDGELVETTYKVIDDVAYWLHKYYRGYLLPDITDAMGETSRQLVHYGLKKEFLFQKCENIEGVPFRHKSNCQYYFIQLRDTEKFVGYIPSMAALTISDARNFILECEKRLFIDLNSSLGNSTRTANLQNYNTEAESFRKRGMGNGKREEKRGSKEIFE